MQLQPKIVDTDAELLAATVSMAIVIKSKNPRMRRPFRESGSASPGILGTGWDPETQSPVPPGERIRRLVPDGCASISAVSPFRRCLSHTTCGSRSGASSEPCTRACNPGCYSVLVERPCCQQHLVGVPIGRGEGEVLIATGPISS